jgi:hypothetical protein
VIIIEKKLSKLLAISLFSLAILGSCSAKEKKAPATTSISTLETNNEYTHTNPNEDAKIKHHFMLLKKQNPNLKIIAEKYYFLEDNTKILVSIYETENSNTCISFTTEHGINLLDLTGADIRFKFNETNPLEIVEKNNGKTILIKLVRDSESYNFYLTISFYENYTSADIKIESEKTQ